MLGDRLIGGSGLARSMVHETDPYVCICERTEATPFSGPDLLRKLDARRSYVRACWEISIKPKQLTWRFCWYVLS